MIRTLSTFALMLCMLPAQAFNFGKELEKQLGGNKPGAESGLSLGGYSEAEEVAIGRQIEGAAHPGNFVVLADARDRFQHRR